MKAALDNDIIFEGVCFGLIDDFVAGLGAGVVDVGALGAARYVLPTHIKRAPLSAGPDQALLALQQFLPRAGVLEPGPEEAAFASELEYAAQRAWLRLDVGESQLCAIGIFRGIGRLATGDKHAIKAIAGTSTPYTRFDNNSVTQERIPMSAFAEMMSALQITCTPPIEHLDHPAFP
jgi:hypothetical protein